MKNGNTNAENFNTLKRTCERIISISDENIDGALMYSQLVALGKSIKEFIENPIVQTSGEVGFQHK